MWCKLCRHGNCGNRFLTKLFQVAAGLVRECCQYRGKPGSRGSGTEAGGTWPTSLCFRVQLLVHGDKVFLRLLFICVCVCVYVCRVKLAGLR